MEIAALAYSVITACDPRDWKRFGEDIAGFSAHELPGGVALRIDERAGRLFVIPGSTDGYFASGWEVRTQGQFQQALTRLTSLGVAFTPATAAERALRHVTDMVWFIDPSGNRHELSYGFVSSFKPFVSPNGTRFVTEDLGYGHAVLPAPKIAETRAFLADTLGLAVSDFMIHRPLGEGGPEMRIDFLHCANGRHHSLALFEGEVPSGCVHLMVEVGSIDEVGHAYDRMLAAGARLMATLGRHTNDHMISFYVQTPGGFALEYGCGGKVIDWDRHTVFESSSASLWGHDFSVGFGADEKVQLADAA
ncbi:3,4-dihydroxy-9,10-secoandrosta-1,3,5(10)-triene-9,17-dione 4,5-dioxygenase [Sphingobium sp. OAS761]|uniref:VOC family protein n=1 Tax=Sphingobium sp. OAS761 TaxID=2817901 RepID=UPI0020A17C8B|nr:VOC family protein [Sphingobium sp. OAS761]MCP1471773.1 3,4-dihydroxy-9,10-secoandrosta-1,3,5(10)-triene-9,17-dione 4,5-dioxygenase [Sphingobium sp. OAS761]